MKRLFFGPILLVLLGVFPIMTIAQVSVGIGVSIPLPPLITFQAPPDVVVLPDTNSVYVVPSVGVDLFFWNGFWWRPWEGRWYRSQYYDRGWAYYNRVPSFYYDVDPYWRGYYQNHNWHGHNWNYQHVPHSQLQQNWKSWQDTRYWEKKKTWGVQGYSPKPQQQRQELRRQRQVQYQQRPEVQQHQQFQKQQQQQRQPQAQEQRQQQQHQPQGQQQQHQQQPQHQGESHQESQGHEGMGEEHRK